MPGLAGRKRGARSHQVSRQVEELQGRLNDDDIWLNSQSILYTSLNTTPTVYERLNLQ